MPIKYEIGLGVIKLSGRNPRKTVNKDSQAELQKSMAESGLAQPILVRPGKPAGHYVLVSGHRRFRAAEALGWKMIPAFIREMSDQEADNLMQIENLQRLDLEPLDEARGFMALAKDHKLPTAEIAAKVGKPTGYVLKRMRLAGLAPKVLKLLEDGEILLIHAEEITRITDPADQVKAAETISNYGDRDWKGIVQKYMLDLKRAPFDTADAQLCPKAGSCLVCPKRTGAQQALFAGGEENNLCQDSKCWDQKLDASTKAMVAELTSQGKKVLQGTEAARVLQDYRIRPVAESRYPLKEGVTFAQAFKDVPGFESIVVIGEDNKPQVVCEPEKWLKKVDKKFLRPTNVTGPDPESPAAKAKALKEKQLRARNNKVIKVLRVMVTKAINESAPPDLNGRLLAMVAGALARSVDYNRAQSVLRRICEAQGVEPKVGAWEDMASMVEKAKPVVQVQFILQLEAGEAVDERATPNINYSDALPKLDAILGLKLAEMRKAAEAQVDGPVTKKGGK